MLIVHGYSDTSTWARGQAWGILNYAQAYIWSKDTKFLQASCGPSGYFLYRLETTLLAVELMYHNGILMHL
ncbi:hypothetical protein B0I35DRAFT_427315 [Stachybotrys elegans]|uniref:Uncharacterized protein n=1 Tax=Stachybotrys elegans TaxID=80388 RepID=A0A8K0SWB6_9HYPO|nr:hypothetical protein B0I35DRAFT_427315 [Stachybotrys elegans]